MRNIGPAGRIARLFTDSKLTPLVIIAGLLLGIASLIALPRQDNPQIIVPMIDVFVRMPGASAKEVEQRVTDPMEKLIWEIPGIEYVYSMSSPGLSMVTARFYVGENEEQAIVRLQSKLMANYDKIPYMVTPPLIKPRYIDDVPIMALTFWSKTADSYTLRRVADEVKEIVSRVRNVSNTQVIGGGSRQVAVRLDPVRLAAYHLDGMQIKRMLLGANMSAHAGSFPSTKGEVLVQVGGFLKNVDDVRQVVVGVYNGQPVYLRDVATISDGPPQPADYVFFGTGPQAREKGIEATASRMGEFPAVTLTIAKRKGSNAVTISEEVLKRIHTSFGKFMPSNIHMTITRNYGESANEKANELMFHMLLAVLAVTVLIWITLGARESGIVALAIPVTLALTLAVFYLLGYTLNRITLFALIFSIAILVDDAIVVVENIVRHVRLPKNQDRPISAIAAEAVGEVGNPTILATFAVIAAILPMAFVRGLMGPYMRPIPVGASAAMVFSLLVAFIVTPWAAIRLLKRKPSAGVEHGEEKKGWSARLYRRIMDPLIHNPRWRWLFLVSIVVLLLASCALVGFGLVTVKMLPFDNKSQFQVLINMPDSATLEDTAAAALAMGEYLKTVNEVTDYETYVGTAAPITFNGLVRHYYLRHSPSLADIHVDLVNKADREEQSHQIAGRVRPALQAIADRFHARVKVVEMPPGPPVMAPLVAEVYGPNYDQQRKIAKKIMNIFEHTDEVVGVDWYQKSSQPRYRIQVDQEKAALLGISVARITQTISMLVSGEKVGLLHLPQEREDVNILVKPFLADRAGISRITAFKVPSANGKLIPLSELVRIKKIQIDQSIYHENLMPVVYVIGNVAGKRDSPVYAMINMWHRINSIQVPGGYHVEQRLTSHPNTDSRYTVLWGGEWHITYEVFRDLGIAFAVVLVLIFILVVGWFRSYITPLVIMTVIPFSLIGILPLHWALGAFFTATSMIGFIAGAGIVVRNSIILVDFIELRLSEGMPLDEAVIDAGEVRFRPMMLTAAAIVVAVSPILFDPIFQGMAISLMAGEVAALTFSMMAVPVLYYLDKRWEHAHSSAGPVQVK